MESGNIAELADPSLERKYDMDQMNRLVLTASYCVRQSSIWRPSMAEVQFLTTHKLWYSVSFYLLVNVIEIPKFHFS